MKKLEDYKIMPIFPGQPVSDPQISPDGTKVLFTYTTANVKEDRYNSHIWLLPLDEKTPKQFTYGKGNDSHPRWSPDGMKLVAGAGKERTLRVYGFGQGQQGEEDDEGDLPPWLLSAVLVLVVGAAGFVVLYYPLLRKFREAGR